MWVNRNTSASRRSCLWASLQNYMVDASFLENVRCDKTSNTTSNHYYAEWGGRRQVQAVIVLDVVDDPIHVTIHDEVGIRIAD